MKIFGFFSNIRKLTEIVIGIFLLVFTYYISKELYLEGFTKEAVLQVLYVLPFPLFGIMLFLPKSHKRDIVIYFLVFFFAGIAFIILSFSWNSDDNHYPIYCIPIGIICFLFAYKYFNKFLHFSWMENTEQPDGADR